MASSQSAPTDDGRRLVATLEGEPCPYCGDGTLERGVYKENRAVLCAECETPHVQLWHPSE